jgi:hypothetical protein
MIWMASVGAIGPHRLNSAGTGVHLRREEAGLKRTGGRGKDKNAR